tara:strand:+ start:5807 stop:6334 length:528 start_codon:yes stop_codon:yes gene_type:complete
MKTRTVKLGADGLVSGMNRSFIDAVTFTNATGAITSTTTNFELIFKIGDRVLISGTSSNNGLIIVTGFAVNGLVMITTTSLTDEYLGSPSNATFQTAQPISINGISIRNSDGSSPLIFTLYDDIIATAGKEIASFIVPALTTMTESLPQIYCANGLYIDGSAWTGTGTAVYAYII